MKSDDFISTIVLLQQILEETALRRLGRQFTTPLASDQGLSQRASARWQGLRTFKGKRSTEVHRQTCCRRLESWVTSWVTYGVSAFHDYIVRLSVMQSLGCTKEGMSRYIPCYIVGPSVTQGQQRGVYNKGRSFCYGPVGHVCLS